MKKSVLYKLDLILILLLFLLNLSVAQNSPLETEPYSRGSPIFPNPANWDTTTIYSASSGTLQKIAIGNHLKGISDDTFRIATGQSPLTRNALILTDTSSMPPMKWRTDIPFTGTGTNGIVSVAIGDVDGDGMNEIIFGQAGGNLKRVKWSGGSWNVTQIDSQGTAVYDIAIGDADNNGVTDIIFARYNYVLRSYWTGSVWQTNIIWSGDGSICQGVAIGDFDSSLPGNEIVATTYNGRVLHIRWNASTWDTLTMHYNSICSFYDPAIGDFDTLNIGNEIVFGNATVTITYGSVIELFGSGINWTSRVIYTPVGTNEGYQNLAIGDVLDEHPGFEIVGTGIRSTTDSVRVFYGSGTSWANQTITGFSQVPALGVAIGDINKYRVLNQEIAFARNTILYEAEQRLPPGPAIINVSHLPKIPIFNETVTVRAIIIDTVTITTDSLYYAINFPSNWLPVTHFNVDSFYYYSIPAQDTSTLVYYFVKAKNNINGETQSSIYSYKVAYEHNIYQIQYISGLSDTSPDINKYVYTRGIVTGVFGRYFNIEEEPGSAWHGIHIQRPALSDTIPNLLIGDSVNVLGRVIEYLNQTVINVFYDSGGRTEKIVAGRPLPCTTIARISQIAESLEGSLVRIDTVRYKNIGYFQPNTSYLIYNFTETESLISFIRSETNIPNESIPQGYLLLTGNISQNLNNYQIVPRAMIDFNLLPAIPGARWEQLADIPTEPSGKRSKSGSCMAGLEATGKIYFLKASNTQDFYSYFPDTGIGNWIIEDTIPIGTKEAGDGKKPKRGAAMTSFEDAIYVLRGNNTIGFWKYVVVGDSLVWTKLKNITPGMKRCKYGSGLTKVSKNNKDYIFAMKGAKTSEFYLYDIMGDSWFQVSSPPIGTSGKKGYKKGSCLAYDAVAGLVYVLQGYYGSFFCYNIDGDSWYQLRQYNYKIFLNRDGKKKKPKDGAALVYYDNNIYMLKGGNTNEVWIYSVAADSWQQMETAEEWDIPLGQSNKKVKDGGSMIRFGDYFYASKGKNTAEFYRHSLPTKEVIDERLKDERLEDEKINLSICNLQSSNQFNIEIVPNPVINAFTIKYILPEPGPMSLKIYNVAGKLVISYTSSKISKNGIVKIDIKNLSSGVYLLRFISKGINITRKVVLEK